MSDEGNPSLLNLRGFRFQKKATFSHCEMNGTLSTSSDYSSEMQNETVKRKIITIDDSDSESIPEKKLESSQPIEPIVPIIIADIFNGDLADSPEEDDPNEDALENETPVIIEANPIKLEQSSPIIKTNFTYVSSRTKSEKVLEKEKQMKFIREMFPNVDAMSIHNVLSRLDFNTDAAIAELSKTQGKHFTAGAYDKWKQDMERQESMKASEEARKIADAKANYEKMKKRSNPVSNTSDFYGRKKKVKRRKMDVDTDDSDVGAEDFADKRVFDSDEDSDVEVTNELTGDKKKVLEFLQTGTPNELLLMASCSKRKVDAITDCRPFKDWVDLVQKLQENKNLSTDLLNSAQQVLTTRHNVQQLMRKCVNLAQQMETAVAAGAGVKEQPDILSKSLKLTSYQMVGLNWLAVMHAQGVNGILADEMGLGKTVQVVSFLAHLKETSQSKGTHLVVVPSSTLENWRLEFERWCPTLNVFMYYGSTEERRMYRIDWSKGTLTNYDVILTTYTMVGNSAEERKMFRVTQMHYVVFDEAHMLKNMNTQRYENLIRIKAMNRILLTGTPLQNNLLELMSLLIFVMPTMFAGKTDDLKSLFQKNSRMKQGDNEDIPAFEREQIAQAKRIMKPFVLRRLKRDVLQDLPKKTDTVEEISLAPTQRENYENLVISFQNVGKDGNDAGAYNGMSMMSDLRKLSNHPLLLRYHYQYEDLPAIAMLLARDPDYKDTVVDYIIDDLACMSDFEINTLTKEYNCISQFALPDNLIVTSGKFLYLDKKLSELKEGNHRVLIFSQYVIMLNVMENYLQIRNYSYLRLDGSTPVNIRQQLIDEYSQDESIFIFLLSTKAGGLGINLTAADTVIIHDIDFNPYNDKQAEDRCHRMGQSRPVSVYRLVSKGTIEEGMWQMNKEKLKLEKEITNEENDSPDVKSVVRLLSSVLGIDNAKATSLVSPKKKS